MRLDRWPVTAYAIRPAGKSDECFYCGAKLGAEHNEGCVIRSRSVVVQVKITLVRTAPEDWTPEQIEWQWGESGWCADNILAHLEALSQYKGCLCGTLETEFIREATQEDEEFYGVFATVEKR